LTVYVMPPREIFLYYSTDNYCIAGITGWLFGKWVI
jgi:hypothetical protein